MSKGPITNCRTPFPTFNAYLPSTTAVGPTAVLKCGDSAKVLKSILTNSVSAIISDPPYKLGFGKKDWDNELPDISI